MRECVVKAGQIFMQNSIAYKEANETKYWLELLHESGYLDGPSFESIYEDCKELIRLLAAITKTQKQTQK